MDAHAAHHRCVIGDPGARADLRFTVGNDHSVIQVVIVGIDVGIIGNRAVFVNNDFAPIIQQHVLVDRAVILDGQVVAVRNLNAVKDLHILPDVFQHMIAKHVLKYIGKNVKIFHGVEVSYGYNLTIEDNCTIHKYVLLDDRGEIIIHENSSISDYANVYSHDHDLNDGMIVTNRKTEIGPRARITYHSTIMSGVRVHEHGLLGSMGVATKDIDPYTISVGIPAKPVKVKSIAPQQQKAAGEKTGM